MEIILSSDPPSDVNLQSDDYIENMQLCREIYGIMHSKYISTPNGINILIKDLLLFERNSLMVSMVIALESFVINNYSFL